MFALDLETSKLKHIEQPGYASPNGRYWVTIDEKAIQVAVLGGESLREIPLTGEAGSSFVHCGADGVYLKTDAGPHEVVFESYRGTVRRRLASGVTRVVCESPDAKLAALEKRGSHGASILEVCEVEAARKLSECQVTELVRAAFSGSPAWLIIGSRGDLDPLSGWLSSDFPVYDALTGKLVKTLHLGRPR